MKSKKNNCYNCKFKQTKDGFNWCKKLDEEQQNPSQECGVHEIQDEK